MKNIFLIVFILCSMPKLFCQQTADSTAFTPLYKHGIQYTLKTTDGTVFKGFVKDETKDFVILENRELHETYELRKSEIVQGKLHKDAQAYEEHVLGENHHARNYMLAQSALLFNKEKMSSTSHLLLLDNFDYALSENWAITANSLLFFYPITLGVKCAYALDDLNYVGGNVFALGIKGSGNNSGLYGYGAIGKFTHGTSNTNFTISGGVIGLSSDVLLNTPTSWFVNTSFISFAYCKRTSKRVALNIEGWYLPRISAGLAGFGIKLVGDEVTCWTFGCYTILSEYNRNLQLNLKTIPIPYFGLSRSF